jgi:hypothetical protein
MYRVRLSRNTKPTLLLFLGRALSVALHHLWVGPRGDSCILEFRSFFLSFFADRRVRRARQRMRESFWSSGCARHLSLTAFVDDACGRLVKGFAQEFALLAESVDQIERIEGRLRTASLSVLRNSAWEIGEGKGEMQKSVPWSFSSSGTSPGRPP